MEKREKTRKTNHSGKDKKTSKKKDHSDVLQQRFTH